MHFSQKRLSYCPLALKNLTSSVSDMHEHKLKLILSQFNFINTWCVVKRRTPANKCFPTPFFHENLLFATTHYKWQISGKTSLSTDIQIIFLVYIDTLLNCNDNKIYFWHGAKIRPYCTSSFEHRVDLNSSRCMHDPSFMALALIVSEKMT